MKRGEQLLELQEVENQLRDIIGAYKKVQKELMGSARVRSARDTYEAAQAAEKEARAQQADLNLAWQGLRQKVDQEEKLLYSGDVKKSRELEDLQLEVDMLKKQLDSLESEALELIESVDVRSQEASTAREDYERITEESRSRQAELEAEENRLKRLISRHRKNREKMLAEIDAVDLEQYRYVQRLKNDTFVVAALNDGVCNACHIEVSFSKRDMVERAPGDRLVTCGNCGRILVAAGNGRAQIEV